MAEFAYPKGCILNDEAHVTIYLDDTFAHIKQRAYGKQQVVMYLDTATRFIDKLAGDYVGGGGATIVVQ